MKGFIIAVVAVVLPALLFCQEEARIFYYKGKVETSMDGNIWSGKNLLGMKLEKAMRIRLEEAAEVSFLNKSGKLYKINQKGIYTAADVEKGFKSSQATFLAAYSEYVWEQLKSHHLRLENYSKGNLKEPGYVSRGCDVMLMLSPPDNSAIIDSAIVFYWNSKKDSSYFNLTMLTGSKKLTMESIVHGAKYEFIIPPVVFSSGTRLSWYVTQTPGENHCFENYLYILPTDTIEKIWKLVNIYLENQGIDEQWRHYWAANVYADYNVFDKAEIEYNIALNIADNAVIRETYMLFRKKYGF